MCADEGSAAGGRSGDRLVGAEAPNCVVVEEKLTVVTREEARNYKGCMKKKVPQEGTEWQPCGGGGSAGCGGGKARDRRRSVRQKMPQ